MISRSRNRIILVLTLCLASMTLMGCPKGTKGLAVASATIAHALTNAQQAVSQGVTTGVISQQEYLDIQSYFTQVAQAGLILDAGIRAADKPTDLATKVNGFLAAFNELNTHGLLHIKNPQVRLAVSTALTGAEAAVSVIAAQIGK